MKSLQVMTLLLIMMGTLSRPAFGHSSYREFECVREMLPTLEKVWPKWAWHIEADRLLRVCYPTRYANEQRRCQKELTHDYLPESLQIN